MADLYQRYGLIHNAFLTNAYENFNADSLCVNVTSRTEVINVIEQFNQSFLQTLSYSSQEKTTMSADMSEYKEFVDSDYLYKKAFSSQIGGVTNVKAYDMLDSLNSKHLIDSFEYNSLTLLLEKAENALKGNISYLELESVVNQQKNAWLSQEYTENSESGQLSGYTLAISLASLEWWANNPTAGDTLIIHALPGWAAMDIAGAIVGGVGAVVNQEPPPPPVNWNGVGGGALWGGAMGSLGAVSRLAKAFQNLF